MEETTSRSATGGVYVFHPQEAGLWRGLPLAWTVYIGTYIQMCYSFILCALINAMVCCSSFNVTIYMYHWTLEYTVVIWLLMLIYTTNIGCTTATRQFSVHALRGRSPSGVCN